MNVFNSDMDAAFVGTFQGGARWQLCIPQMLQKPASERGSTPRDVPALPTPAPSVAKQVHQFRLSGMPCFDVNQPSCIAVDPHTGICFSSYGSAETAIKKDIDQMVQQNSLVRTNAPTWTQKRMDQMVCNFALQKKECPFLVRHGKCKFSHAEEDLVLARSRFDSQPDLPRPGFPQETAPSGKGGDSATRTPGRKGKGKGGDGTGSRTPPQAGGDGAAVTPPGGG